MSYVLCRLQHWLRCYSMTCCNACVGGKKASMLTGLKWVALIVCVMRLWRCVVLLVLSSKWCRPLQHPVNSCAVKNTSLVRCIQFHSVCWTHMPPYWVNLYFNVANSNKSDNLAITCQWQVLTESYLTRSTKLLWSNLTHNNIDLMDTVIESWICDV